MRYIFVLCLLPLMVQGQTGPGGIGDINSNRFWLDAGSIDLPDNSAVGRWTNAGGSPNDFTQDSNPSTPVLILNGLNGLPVVRFSQNNRFLQCSSVDLNEAGGAPWSRRTYHFCIRVGDISSTTKQVLFSEGGTLRGFNLYFSSGQVHLGAWNKPNDGAGTPWNESNPPIETNLSGNTEHIVSMVFDGNTTITGTLEMYVDGEFKGVANDVGIMFKHNSFVLGMKNGTLYLDQNSDGIGDDFEGDVAEFIQYDYNNNEAQVRIIHNYLAAKYDLSLDDYDIYKQDDPGNGDYDHEVAGIGRVDANNLHNDAQGTGIVRINNPSELDDDEFLIWGNDEGAERAIETVDVPTGVQTRMEKVWRVSETSRSGSAVDVGSIDMSWDLTEHIPVTASDLRLLIDTNNNGFFNDDIPLDGATDIGNNRYQFSGVMGITNNVRFTLATINTMQTALPIELVYFRATPFDEHTVRVAWKTVSEKNNNFFTVSRSVDGKEWQQVTQVSGAGNSAKPLYYAAIDDNPYAGVSYYRLIQTDLDGTFTYSPIQSVNMSAQNKTSLYPNPTENQITIEGEQIEKARIQILNSIGREVRIAPQKIVRQDKLIFDTKDMKEGFYLFIIHNVGKVTETHPVLIRKKTSR